jgi:hypothetical protein
MRRNLVLTVASVVARNASEATEAPLVGFAFGEGLESGGRFCVRAFGTHLTSVAVNTFPHLQIIPVNSNGCTVQQLTLSGSLNQAQLCLIYTTHSFPQTVRQIPCYSEQASVVAAYHNLQHQRTAKKKLLELR